MASHETSIDPVQSTDAAPADEGLRCLECDYNLTGLFGDICPECGKTLDWPAVRKYRDERRRRRATPWQSWRWYLKPFAFLVTAAQVALTPWLFARRLPDPPRLLWPTLFLAICLGVAGCASLLRGLPETDWWLAFVLLHGLLQTGGLFVVGRGSGVDHPLRFGLAVTCYTAWAVVVEGCLGVDRGHVAIWCDKAARSIRLESNVWPISAIPSPDSYPAALWPTVLLYVWLAGLTTIVGVRMHRGRIWRLPLAILIVIAITVLLSIPGYFWVLMTH